MYCSDFVQRKDTAPFNRIEHAINIIAASVKIMYLILKKNVLVKV